MDIRTDIDMKNNSIFNSNLEGLDSRYPTYTTPYVNPQDVPQGQFGETWQPPGFPVMAWRPAENDVPAGWNGSVVSVNTEDGTIAGSIHIDTEGIIRWANGAVGDRFMELGRRGLILSSIGTSIWGYSGDPTVDGWVAVIGSILIGNDNGEDPIVAKMWQKIGDGDTDWADVNGFSGGFIPFILNFPVDFDNPPEFLTPTQAGFLLALDAQTDETENGLYLWTGTKFLRSPAALSAMWYIESRLESFPGTAVYDPKWSIFDSVFNHHWQALTVPTFPGRDSALVGFEIKFNININDLPDWMNDPFSEPNFNGGIHDPIAGPLILNGQTNPEENGLYYRDPGTGPFERWDVAPGGVFYVVYNIDGSLAEPVVSDALHPTLWNNIDFRFEQFSYGSGGSSFPKYTNSFASPPTDAEQGDSWIPAEVPVLMLCVDSASNTWSSSLFTVDGTNQLVSGQILINPGKTDELDDKYWEGVNAIIATSDEGVAPGSGRVVKLNASGLKFGDAAGPSIWGNEDDPSAVGWRAGIGSLFLQGTETGPVSQLWHKTGPNDIDWEVVGGGSSRDAATLMFIARENIDLNDLPALFSSPGSNGRAFGLASQTTPSENGVYMANGDGTVAKITLLNSNLVFNIADATDFAGGDPSMVNVNWFSVFIAATNSFYEVPKPSYVATYGSPTSSPPENPQDLETWKPADFPVLMTYVPDSVPEDPGN